MTDVGYEPAADGARRSSETVAGYLAALSIFVSLIALAWHPLRLLGPSILIALVAAAMGGRHHRLALAAAMIAAACFFFAMTIAVVTSRALW